MKLSAAIMAHPRRRELVADLVERVPAPIIWDRNAGEWDTARRALLTYDAGAEYHLVIQDDALVPAGDFLPALEHVLEHVDAGTPVGLYLGRCRPEARLYTLAVRMALERGLSWLEEFGGPRWGVAIAYPVADLERLVEWGDEHGKPRVYDARVHRFYRAENRHGRYCIPSLVDHDYRRESVLGSQPGKRCAHVYLDDRPVDAVDWSTPALKIDYRRRLAVPTGA